MIDVEKTIESIAQKHLSIETLETRNSDSLDFHDVSAWQLRKALLCAFEAGRQASRSKPKKDKSSKEGTCYRATIEASYQDLVDIWGEPSKGDEYKIEAEWVIRPTRDTAIIIYNYKNSRAYDYNYPEITAVREWHVGGHRADVVDRLLKMMAGRAKLIQRANDPSSKD
ncbi:MAG: hypothetical protein PHD48_07640 [Alphaproteobacteria bacterium]|nr:hypothetical protein [Alphaproteobacteria bacterium]